MSRLIVKNLPQTVNEQKLRDLFGQKGAVTDVQLKFKDGKFRKFAFVGYENEEAAAAAEKFFDSTFIGTSRIKVEVCAALGDETKPKPWSKHTKDTAVIKKSVEIEPESLEETEPKKTISKNAAKIDTIIGDRKNDPLFQEFMKSHAKDKITWANDIEVEDGTEDPPEETETSTEKLANKDITDEDYMNQLMGKKLSKQPKVQFEKSTKKSKEEMVKLFTIKIRNLPSKLKREELIKFFRPSKAYSVRIPRTSGFAYVGFKLERDMQRALLKDKSFFKGKQILVYDFTEKNFQSDSDASAKQRQNPRWEQQQDELKNEEDICESGKLFFRNLAYTVTEEDVQKVFEKYGTVVEVNIPIDTVTRKIKGFGTVTFMMPEHGVTAYNELNGTMFHGRMFHLLPGKANDKGNDDDGGSNFKKKKQQELRKTAGLSHNWNTLFLGTNAVADAMAKTYGKSKEEVLDSSTGGSSAAVRLALGETQIVLEMKKFLEGNGVSLEAFDDVNAKRSKTTILAKNLPAGTEVEELRERFVEFGVIEKFLLPPSGVTCLIKFEQPTEARKAFRRLAYSKFKHLPLYLEWAPENTFKQSKDSPPEETKAEKTEEVEEKSEKVADAVELEENDDDDEDDEEPQPNTTLFIKNLNFETTEETVRDNFKHLGAIHVVQIAKRRNPDNPQMQTPLGYGFIQFKMTSSADKALKTMQFCVIDDKQIELKRSDRTVRDANAPDKKQSKKKDQKTSTKIMVRNIPFQANTTEIKNLFKVFGELKAVRLPKKMGSDQHRGFGFIDFISKTDAKSAFEALHHSTHLYGRRLVLEWAEADQDVEEIRKRTAEHMSLGESNPKKSKKSVLKTEDGFGEEESE